MKISSSWRLPLLLTGAVALLSACAPAATGGASGGASASGNSAVRRSNLLTREELEASGTSNLYDAINRLRPQWLRSSTNTQTRTTGEGGLSVVVYQGTTQLGGVEILRQMAPGYVATIRYLDGNQASNTLPGLGSRMVAGAIVLELPRD